MNKLTFDDGGTVELTDADLETINNALDCVAADCQKFADDESLPRATRNAMLESRKSYLKTLRAINAERPE